MAEKKRSNGITLGSTTIRPDKLLSYFEDLARKMGIRVIYDRGAFRGGTCLLKEERVIVVNQHRPIEERLRILARGFTSLDLSGVYLVPVLRAYLELVQESMIP
ncbi:MAG: hypothetical protein GXO90_10235 [FCB group bacterium]|nr:hypothetical protein [FCB group bacterium]